MRSEKVIFVLAFIAMLLVGFSALSPIQVSAIVINDYGWEYSHGFEGREGFIDYQNLNDYNVSGTIKVEVDGNETAEHHFYMEVKYFKGFRMWTRDSFEFPLPETAGTHNVSIVLTAEGINETVGFSYDIEAPEEDTDSEEVEEWLACP